LGLTVEIDAQLVLDAAGRVEMLWPDEPCPPGGIGWTGSQHIVAFEDATDDPEA